MHLEYIFLTFSALTGGRLTGISRSEENLSLKIEHPGLAALHKPGTVNFFITLRPPFELAFQMSDHANSLLINPKEIEKLGLTLQYPHRFQGINVKVPCGMNDEQNHAGDLVVKANGVRIFDEDFDPLRPDEMAHLEYLLSNRKKS